jgi:hypothetical protein
MKKYALCLYGQTPFDKGVGINQQIEEKYKVKNIFYRCLKSWDKNFLNDDIDVYIHTWCDDEIEKQKLIEIFKPKSHIMEKQREFTIVDPNWDLGLSEILEFKYANKIDVEIEYKTNKILD